MTLKSVVSIPQPAMIPLAHFEDFARDAKARQALAAAFAVAAYEGG
jgi:hypothetical protein